jgi:hypothetical protein
MAARRAIAMQCVASAGLTVQNVQPAIALWTVGLQIVLEIANQGTCLALNLISPRGKRTFTSMVHAFKRWVFWICPKVHG